jgi:hypothetical protein
MTVAELRLTRLEGIEQKEISREPGVDSREAPREYRTFEQIISNDRGFRSQTFFYSETF